MKPPANDDDDDDASSVEATTMLICCSRWGERVMKIPGLHNQNRNWGKHYILLFHILFDIVRHCSTLFDVSRSTEGKSSTVEKKARQPRNLVRQSRKKLDSREKS